MLAVAWPIYDYFVDWPTFQRRLKEKPSRARVHEYWGIISQQWLMVFISTALLLRAGADWFDLGLRMPKGLRLWISSGILILLASLFAKKSIALARSPERRGRLRKSTASVGALLPHTAEELGWFLAVSLTAGLCEEFLFRGYFIWAIAPSCGWWAAAGLSALAFGLLHAYQGRNGVISTALVAVFMTLLVAVTRSLFPAMALHALMDAGNGFIIWDRTKSKRKNGGLTGS